MILWQSLSIATRMTLVSIIDLNVMGCKPYKVTNFIGHGILNLVTKITITVIVLPLSMKQVGPGQIFIFFSVIEWLNSSIMPLLHLESSMYTIKLETRADL